MFDFLKHFRKKPVVIIQEQATETSGLGNLEETNTIADLLPGIRHLAVNLTIVSPDREIEPSLNNRSFGPQSRAYFKFRCKNVNCVDGGFDLQDDILATAADSRNELSGRRVCHGWRSADLVGQQKCYFELNFKAHISYSEEHA